MILDRCYESCFVGLWSNLCMCISPYYFTSWMCDLRAWVYAGHIQEALSFRIIGSFHHQIMCIWRAMQAYMSLRAVSFAWVQQGVYYFSGFMLCYEWRRTSGGSKGGGGFNPQRFIFCKYMKIPVHLDPDPPPPPKNSCPKPPPHPRRILFRNTNNVISLYAYIMSVKAVWH